MMNKWKINNLNRKKMNLAIPLTLDITESHKTSRIFIYLTDHSF